MFELKPFIAGSVIAGVVTAALNIGVPVVAFVSAKDGKRIGDTFEAEVFSRKVRSCGFERDSEIGWVQRGGIWFESRFEFADDETPGNTRPTGTQSMGLWRWFDVPPEATAVKTTVVHDCGGNPRVTTIGPFAID